MVRDDEKRVILFLHMAGVALQGAGLAMVFILPFLARRRFEAENWQSWVLTAAMPVMQFFTIFWNHLYARIPSWLYLVIIAVLSCIPVALMAFAQSMTLLMICLVVAAFGGAGGGAGLSPINADLLRNCYRDRVRGRVYGMITASQFFGVIVAGWIMGRWSDLDPDGYRFFLPLTAASLATGLFLFALISRTDVFRRRPRPVVETGQQWWTPLRDMGRILRADHRFAAYETAFMSYGVGWMICTALVPLLAKDKLDLDYGQFSRSTIIAFQFTMILMLVPMGRLADRVGAVRLAAGSFLWLTLYPLGLLFVPVGSEVWLGVLTMLYALGMTGVHLTWTLGPVGFAPDAERASHYLAVHGTLAGVRGIVVQGVGIWLYSITGRFWPAMLLGAAGFLWGSMRMRRLAREKG